MSCLLSRTQKSPHSIVGAAVVPEYIKKAINEMSMMIHRKLPPNPGAGRRRGFEEGGVLGFGFGLEGIRDPLIVSYRRLHSPCAAPIGRRPHPETHTYSWQP